MGWVAGAHIRVVSVGQQHLDPFLFAVDVIRLVRVRVRVRVTVRDRVRVRVRVRVRG